ncbi:hypothetical protein ACEV6G_20405 [Enterobacter ludwigii]|uniref:hypothetical protein n=1 Tax=Enterobacter ludwigii TaxID=299767 RepID=UPI00325F022C
MIRTLEFMNWKEFLSERNESYSLTLDFQIDAGFSFTQAVAFRKMQKTGKSVALDGSLKVPSRILQFNNLILCNTVILHSVEIYSHSFQNIETTERYTISAQFSPCSIDHDFINTELSKRLKSKNDNCSEETIILLYMVDYFNKFAETVKNEIISFLELSSNYVRLVNGSFNLYIYKNEKPYRVTQQSGGQDSAWHNPVHPLALKSHLVQERYETLSRLPENIKIYLSKGAHYKFLGFYDESFIIYYKIVETIFKGNIFPSILAECLFDSTDKKLLPILKNANQKNMMLYIFQWFIKVTPEASDVQKKEIMNQLLDACYLRNEISHSVDQSKESKKQLPFIISLSHNLISAITTNRISV